MNTRQSLSATAAGLVLALALLSGCGQDQSSKDDLAPSAPRWVDRSADNMYAQQGIRAEPVQNDLGHPNSDYHWVHLEWYANPESDVTTYRVWRISETEQNPLRHYVIKDLRVGLDLPEGQSIFSWVDRGENPNDGSQDNLAPDETTGQSRGFYWEIQAIDSAGNRSTLSPRLYYRLLANPTTLSAERAAAQVYTLNYVYTPGSEDDRPLYDMIRVYSHYYGPDSLVTFQQIHRYETLASITLDFRGIAASLVRDCTYVCQVNVICNRVNEAHTDSLAGAAAFTTFSYQP
ncbi:MAG TPA: hypothetical protein VGL38_14570 [bacterium]|jgi:hypothetical protein